MKAFLAALVAAVGLALVWSGIAPYDRTTWWLEVFPVLIGAPLLLLTARRFPLTPLTYTLLALHALILIVGGHYTFARVPLGFWVQDLLGLKNTLIPPAVDSGITYLILTQSLPGVLLLWLFIVYSGADATAEQVRYSHALCLYISLSMLVSYAFLTIKTASLAWFIQGALQHRRCSSATTRTISTRSARVSG